MLKGKNAIVTGARTGIGRATVECFAKEGANIWACAHRENEQFAVKMQPRNARRRSGAADQK